jgi:hypothetical protein
MRTSLNSLRFLKPPHQSLKFQTLTSLSNPPQPPSKQKNDSTIVVSSKDSSVFMHFNCSFTAFIINRIDFLSHSARYLIQLLSQYRLLRAFTNSRAKHLTLRLAKINIHTLSSIISSFSRCLFFNFSCRRSIFSL